MWFFNQSWKKKRRLPRTASHCWHRLWLDKQKRASFESQFEEQRNCRRRNQGCWDKYNIFITPRVTLTFPTVQYQGQTRRIRPHNLSRFYLNCVRIRTIYRSLLLLFTLVFTHSGVPLSKLQTTCNPRRSNRVKNPVETASNPGTKVPTKRGKYKRKKGSRQTKLSLSVVSEVNIDTVDSSKVDHQDTPVVPEPKKRRTNCANIGCLRLDFKWLSKQSQKVLITKIGETSMEWIKQHMVCMSSLHVLKNIHNRTWTHVVYCAHTQADCVSKFTDNGVKFQCKCGSTINISVGNWKSNVVQHINSSQCKKLRKRLCVWHGWCKQQKRSPVCIPPMTPENLARLKCLGLWRTVYKMSDGRMYKMSLIPPLGLSSLYYISRRPIHTTRTTLAFSVHHADCKGLAHDVDFKPIPERTCDKCMSLFNNSRFIQTLRKSNEPTRMKVCCFVCVHVELLIYF